MPAPQRAQRLDVGGEFSDHFTLYCPQGYERDALYLFDLSHPPLPPAVRGRGEQHVSSEDCVEFDVLCPHQ